MSETPQIRWKPSADQAVLALVAQTLLESSAVKVAAAAELPDALLQLIRALERAFGAGGKLVLFGNGGSAADAQHIAAEFVVRFRRNRAALPAMAVTTDTSALTAIGNDFSFDQLFARQVDALVRPGDVVVGLSTSGGSRNVVEGLKAARARGGFTIGFTGIEGGSVREVAHLCYCAPSALTARIQEVHLCVWHAVCDAIESSMA